MRLLFSLLCLLSVVCAHACTSMLVSAKTSATGRPLMWKHRDTGTEHNFVERVNPADGIGYVALFNGGDSLLTEAWMGMNDAGFAVMNTASYNLAPDTAAFKDAEGLVMTAALKSCRSVDDFENLLRTLPKPMGVQANFGVMDAYGDMAYFETDDYKYTRFNIGDDPDSCSVTGCMIRTNHSLTGNDTDGFGYVRFENARHILAPEIETGTLSPWAFTENASRSFWHSLIGRDMAQTSDRWVVDQDFIPRNISSASVVIEGVNPGENPQDMAMWTVIGYPPCSSVQLVSLSHVPDGLRPVAPGYRSPACNTVIKLKRKAFPIHHGNGNKYIDMDFLRPLNALMRQRSISEYKKHYKNIPVK